MYSKDMNIAENGHGYLALFIQTTEIVSQNSHEDLVYDVNMCPCNA